MNEINLSVKQKTSEVLKPTIYQHHIPTSVYILYYNHYRK